MKQRSILAVGVLLLVGFLGIAVSAANSQDASQESSAPPPTPEINSDVQPIAFPHNVHAQTYQMDCAYCHYSAERSVSAGIPPVESCMGCHNLINGVNNQDEIQKLRDYYNEGEPIPWHRIYKISDHAHFPHMRHVNAGLECQECHGQVQEMAVIESRDPAWGGDNMGWCISCHVEQEVTIDCTACHY